MSNFAFFLVFSQLFVSNSHSISTQPVVDLSIGKIYGKSTKQSHEYLGIPYANVSKRWMPPYDLYHTKFQNNTFNATKYGPCCAQLSLVPIPLPTAEQCQYLNIFTPPNISPSSHLPVMLWLYGGGDKFGCASQSLPILYNGSNLIARSKHNRNVIIVTMNYRLDILSALYLPELAKENSAYWNTSGNYGILDIVSALKWIQVHITSFGGDPNRVTIFGQSAGGNYAMNLPAFKPIANGLFHHVISESGTAFVSAGYSNISEAAQFSYQIAEAAGCTNYGDDDIFLSCLRKANITEMMTIFQQSGWVSISVVDDVILLDYPQRLVENNKYMNVSVWIGNNYPDFMPTCIYLPSANASFAVQYCNENLPLWGVPVDDLEDVYDVYGLYNCTAAADDAMDPNVWCCSIVTQIFIDYAMKCAARRALSSMYTYMKQRELYLYEFQCTPYCPSKQLPICQHTSEIAYVFGTISDYESNNEDLDCKWNNHTRIFSDKVIDVWTSFAYHEWSDADVSHDIPSKFVPYNANSNELGYSEYFYIGPDAKGFQNKRFVQDDKCDLFDRIENTLNTNMFGSNPNNIN